LSPGLGPSSSSPGPGTFEASLPSLEIYSPSSALARLDASETLIDAYAAWRELLESREAFRHEVQIRRRQLEEDASFILGTVGRASSAPVDSTALSLIPATSSLLLEASERLNQAREELARAEADTEQSFWESIQRAREEVRSRVVRHAATVKPRLRLARRGVGAGRAILHLDRPTDDDAVVLCQLLLERPPTRHEFMSDEATEDSSLASPVLYPDAPISVGDVRAVPDRIPTLLESCREFVPLRNALWMRVDDGSWFRWLQRGPVLELERVEPQGFRNILEESEAQAAASLLVSLKLQGKIFLEWVSG
jgi:hypothetical protein